MNLRIIRTLILKVLYAHIFSQRMSSESDLASAQKHLLNDVERAHKLYFCPISVFLEVGKHWERIWKRRKRLEFLGFFSENFLYQTMLQDKTLQKNMIDFRIDFAHLFDEYPLAVMHNIAKSSLPQAYRHTTKSIENQRKFARHVFEQFIATDESLHEFYADQDLAYSEDDEMIAFANTLFRKTLLGTNPDEPATHPKRFKNEYYRKFIIDLLNESINQRFETEKIIKTYLVKGWTFDRLSSVCRTVLLLASTELLHFKDIPPKPIITEYLSISNDYMEPQEIGFLNAVLDGISNRVQSVLPS